MTAPLAASPAAPPPLLTLHNLEVVFPGADGRPFAAVRRVSFAVAPGEIVGLVGESGSGKTLTALAALRLVPAPGQIRGAITFAGEDLLALPEAEMRRRRGGRLAIVFQDPMSALHPAFSIGFQLVETVRAHHALSRRAARQRATELLAQVALSGPERRLADYPHQLSGGQQQRVLLAMALAGSPALLFADEPTTALDVTVQAEILDLLTRLRRDLGLAIVLVSHDLALVADRCDRVLVLYAGELVEEIPATELVARARHPYTKALLATVPRLGQVAPRGAFPVLLGLPADVRNLPQGCAFQPRCAEVMEICGSRSPDLVTLAPGSRVRCWHHPGLPERPA